MAGVSISVVVGDNGVLSQAQKASVKTEVSKFNEDAGLAFSEIYADKASSPLGGTITVSWAEVQERLEQKYGYSGKITLGVPDEGSEITGIAFSNSSDSTINNLVKDDTTTVSVVRTTPSGNQPYYVNIKGKYYPIHESSSSITILENEGRAKIEPQPDDSTSFTAVSNDESVVVATGNKNNGELEVSLAGKARGNATVTVTYGEYAPITINVTVKGKVTVTLSVDSTDNGAVNGNPSTVSKSPTKSSGENTENLYVDGDIITLTANANSGYKLGGWYIGGLKQNLTNNQYTVTPPNDNSDTVAIVAKFVSNVATYGAIANFSYTDSSTGETVNAKTKVGENDLVSDWKYFYNKEDGSDKHIELIYSYYLENARIPNGISGANIAKSGYKVYVSSVGRNNLINYLKNTNSEWDDFATGVQNAINAKLTANGVKVSDAPDAAILQVNNVTAKGALTPEEFKRSFNAMNPTVELNVKNVSQGENIKDSGNSSANADGWVYRKKNVDYAYSVSLGLGSLQVGSDSKGLYLPETSYSNAYGYWLAAPSAYGADFVCSGYYSGGLNIGSYDYGGYGVRPVVSIPYSNVTEANKILTALGLQ